MACESCVVRDALILTLEALDRFANHNGSNIVGENLHAALLKLKGGTKLPEPKRVILACNIDAFLYPDGRLRVEARHKSHDGMPPPPITLSLDSEATKRLAMLLKDGE